MAGGKGLDDFRSSFINDKHISQLNDFTNCKECFPNNDIKGGVCYFLWDRDHNDKCQITTHYSNEIKTSERYLKEEGCDIFIRDEILIDILKKVRAKNKKTLDTIVSARKPYGLEAETMVSAKKYKLPEFSDTKIDNGFEIFGLGEKMKRCWKYIPHDYPIPKISPCLYKYKVFIAEAYGCGSIGEVPSTPLQLCTETFLEIGPFDNEIEATNMIKYIKTKFFRCLVGIQKQTQHTTQKVYRFVPMQNFTDNSDINWNNSIENIDIQLFTKYNLNDDEKKFIEDNIQEIK